MQLCDKCRQITDFFIPDPRDAANFGPGLAGQIFQHPHHPTFAHLDEAARDGCQPCRFFKKFVLEENLRLEKERSHHAEPSDFSLSIDTYSIHHAADARGILGLEYHFKSGPFPVEESDDTRGWYETPSLSFGLSCSPDSIASTKWGIVGRATVPTADFRLAQHWINEILDIGTDPNSLIKLLIRPYPDNHAPYATLSHCWGISQPLKLTKSTLASFQTGIPFSSLPRTFQDAVTAARSLNLQYLWIDSLCIIQDCRSDWEEQCVEMRRIYQNSHVNLAGPNAPNCDAGFLHPRETARSITIHFPLGETTCPVTLFCHPSTPNNSSVQQNITTLIRQSTSSISTTTPLFTRAWILQERLLAPRVLYLAPDKMYFECSRFVRTDTCHYPLGPQRFFLGNTPSRFSFSQLQEQEDAFDWWRQIVSGYSGMELTKKSDKLPALSGLAAEAQRFTGARYLAGLWMEDLPQGLAWYVLDRAEREGMKGYIGPSWSWVGVNRRVIMYSVSGVRTFEADAGFGVVDLGVTPKGLDPCGEVEDGAYLEVWGKLLVDVALVFGGPPVGYARDDNDLFLPGTLDDPDEGFGSGTDSNEDDWDEMELKPALGRFYPDGDCGLGVFSASSRNIGGTEFTAPLLLLGSYSDDVVVVLALEAVEGKQDTYRRIGLVQDDETRGTAYAAGLKELFDGVIPTKIRLV